MVAKHSRGRGYKTYTSPASTAICVILGEVDAGTLTFLEGAKGTLLLAGNPLAFAILALVARLALEGLKGQLGFPFQVGCN